MLKQRLLTAVILIAIVLLALFYLPPLLFAFALALILGLAIWEWTFLMGFQSLPKRWAYLISLEVLFFIWLIFPHPILSFIILCLSIFAWITALFFILYNEKFTSLWSGNDVWRMIMGGFMFIPCWIALNLLRAYPQGPLLILLLLILIWAADTGAYFVGRRFGKHKLAAKISPGKTIEGFVGGMILVLIVASMSGFLLKLDLFHWVVFLFIALLTGLVSVVGDLFESLVKRQSKVKDSGQILPGHGGLLDRIDSLLAAAPVFALGVILFF